MACPYNDQRRVIFGGAGLCIASDLRESTYSCCDVSFLPNAGTCYRSGKAKSTSLSARAREASSVWPSLARTLE